MSNLLVPLGAAILFFGSMRQLIRLTLATPTRPGHAELLALMLVLTGDGAITLGTDLLA